MNCLHLCVIQLYSFRSSLHCSHSSGQTGCWIDPGFAVGRLGASIWVWVTLFASVILYIPLYFWAGGFWSVDEENRFHWSKSDQRVEYAEASYIGNAPVSNRLIRLSSRESRSQIFGHQLPPGIHPCRPSSQSNVVGNGH